MLVESKSWKVRQITYFLEKYLVVATQGRRDRAKRFPCQGLLLPSRFAQYMLPAQRVSSRRGIATTVTAEQKRAPKKSTTSSELAYIFYPDVYNLTEMWNRAHQHLLKVASHRTSCYTSCKGNARMYDRFLFALTRCVWRDLMPGLESAIDEAGDVQFRPFLLFLRAVLSGSPTSYWLRPRLVSGLSPS